MGNLKLFLVISLIVKIIADLVETEVEMNNNNQDYQSHAKDDSKILFNKISCDFYLFFGMGEQNERLRA